MIKTVRNERHYDKYVPICDRCGAELHARASAASAAKVLHWHGINKCPQRPRNEWTGRRGNTH
jgi:hypothetical protein